MKRDKIKKQEIINPLIEDTMNKTLVSARKVNGVVKSYRIDFHHPHIKNERIRPKGTYATYKDAYEIAEKMYYEILVKHRNPNAFSNYKLNDAIDMYCENRGDLGKDVGYIDWIRERIGNKDIQQVNQMDYQRLIRECRDKGNKNRTINRKLEILRAILNHAKDELDWIQAFPKITKLKEQKYTPYPYSLEEIDAIRNECVGDYAYLRDFIDFSIMCGRRKANITGLKKHHIHQGIQGLIMVIPARETKEGKKTGEDFVLPLGTEAEKIIKRNWHDDTDYIFKGYKGKANIGDPKRAFNGILKRLGIKQRAKEQGSSANFHSFRHTCATQLAQIGMNEFQIREITGHSDIRMLRQYVKLGRQDIKDIMNKRDEIFVPKASPIKNGCNKKSMG